MKPSDHTILIVDDEPDVRETLCEALLSEGYGTESAGSAMAAVEVFRNGAYDLVISDFKMSGMDGLELMRRLKELDAGIEVIILTAYASVEIVIEAMKGNGAYNFLTKPLENIDELYITVERALERRRLSQENQALLERLTHLNSKLKTGYDNTLNRLMESEFRFRNLFRHNHSVMLIIDPENGNIFDANPAAARFYGCSLSLLRRKKIFDINQLPENEVLSAMRSAQKKRAVFFNFRHLLSDGSVREVEVHSAPIKFDRKEYLYSIVHDVTERNKAQQEIAENEQRFRELFGHIKTGVAVFTSPDDGEHFLFSDLNRYGLQYTKEKKDGIIGRDICSVFPGITETGLYEMLKRVWHTGTPEEQGPRLYRNGKTEFWFESSVYRLPSGEIVAIFEDVSEKKKAEKEKREIENLLRRSQKMEAIGNLAGGIAHDFNNILFPILGFSEMMLQDLPEDSEAHENLRQIHTAGRRGAELVRQILSFSRQSKPRKLPIKLQSIIKEVLKLSRSTIPSSIRISQDIQKACGMIEADPVQLHQIVMNLMTNAYHAVEDRNGSIWITLKEVSVGSSSSHAGTLGRGRYALLSVADNGTGIEAGILDKIFDPYFTTKIDGKGTGLGLSVVHGIVKEHKGDIKVHSKPGRGTTFSVYLPLMEKIADMDTRVFVEDDPGGDEQILLVEDDEHTALTQKKMLERLGYAVTMRLNSIEGFEAFRARPDDFDLVITDMNMPVMPGDLLATKLLAIRPGLPILMCTGFSEKITEAKARHLGVKGLLMKPILKSQLAETVRRIIDEAKTA